MDEQTTAMEIIYGDKQTQVATQTHPEKGTCLFMLIDQR